MNALLVMFGGFWGLVVLLTVVLTRRRRRYSRTESAEGLLIEQRAREQAAQDRVTYHPLAVHDAPISYKDIHNRP
ncbi:hypothetical protein GCM10022244_47080 [Streptomyces gulbargensis]|uniref:Secreted protein n=1 Tax=Streptomyces gulbargensis TaxID=364901 RepID=A0ABP7MYZ7_9ACTN